MKFTDLLALSIDCEAVVGQSACILVIGETAPALADQLAAAAAAAGLRREHGKQRVLFGLPVLTLPYPILVHSLMTERNTALNQLSLFGWIEDNAILEPRAEIFGLTPLGGDPVLFVRDLDLDRPPECYLRSGSSFKRIAGVVIAHPTPAGECVTLAGNDGALSALEVSLPPESRSFIASLRADVAAGRELRQVLRARRRDTDPALMAQCDGWRVLGRAARFVLADAGPFSADQSAAMTRLKTIFSCQLPVGEVFL